MIYDTTLYVTMHYDTIRYNTTQFGLRRYNIILYDTLRYDTIQYDTIQYDTIPYDTIRYNTTQHNKIQYNIFIKLVETICAETVTNWADIMGNSLPCRFYHLLKKQVINGQQVHACCVDTVYQLIIQCPHGIIS